jgi:hypothetical protein
LGLEEVVSSAFHLSLDAGSFLVLLAENEDVRQGLESSLRVVVHVVTSSSYASSESAGEELWMLRALWTHDAAAESDLADIG